MLACCCIDQKDTFSQQEPCLFWSFSLSGLHYTFREKGATRLRPSVFAVYSIRSACSISSSCSLWRSGSQMNMPRLTVFQPVSLYAPDGCLLLLLGQNDRTICCNGQRMLVLSRQAAVQRACGPAVRINFTAVCACVEHWLNCNDHTLF